VGLRQQRGGAPPSGAGPAPKQKNDAAAKQPNVNDDSATHELIAVAYASPPIGRCQRWVLIVPRCPACAHCHVHRSTGPHGGRRTGSCGASYSVVLAGWQRSAS
jgi:hypothetical protein